MHLYCQTRFLYPDATCDAYKKMGCQVKDLHRILNMRGQLLFSRSREVFEKRIIKNEKIITDDMKYSKECQKLAFQRYVIIFTAKTCVISKSTFYSQMTLGNRSSNPNPASWYHYVNVLTFIAFFIMIQLWVVYSRVMIKRYEEMIDCNQDYAIEIDGLPRDFKDKHYNMNQEIKRMFDDKHLKVARVSLIYDSDEYTDLSNTLIEKRSLLAKLNYKLKNKLMKFSEPGCVGQLFGQKSDYAKVK